MEPIDRRLMLSAAGLAGAAALARVAAAGPLNPPAGPVSSTGRTLTEIEPRTLVGPTTTPGDANAVYIISQPGSYALPGPIATSGGRAGIRIAANHVTLDLQGFTIDGSGDTTGFATGIDAAGSQRNIVIRNGTIRGFRGYGIFGTMSESLFESLNVSDNNAGNLELFNSDGCIARNIHVRSTTGEAGIQLSNDALVLECRVSGPGSGILVGLGSIVARCSVSGCPAKGIAIGGGVVSECAVSNQTSTSSFNNGGIVLTGATLVSRCSLRACTAAGLFLGGQSAVTECEFMGCARGIAASTFQSGAGRIENNYFSFCNTVAIQLQTARHLVAGNRFTQCAAAIDAVPGSAIGELLDFSAGGTLSASSTHPAANLIF